MIIFTANHCKTAQAYEGRIIQLVADYKDKGVAVVGIAPNDPQALSLSELVYSDLSDSFEELKIRAQGEGIQLSVLYDGDSQKVSRAYGPDSTPHVFIFDQERKLRYVGRIDDSENVPAAVMETGRPKRARCDACRKTTFPWKDKNVWLFIKWSRRGRRRHRSWRRWRRAGDFAIEADLQTIKGGRQRHAKNAFNQCLGHFVQSVAWPNFPN